MEIKTGLSGVLSRHEKFILQQREAPNKLCHMTDYPGPAGWVDAPRPRWEEFKLTPNGKFPILLLTESNFLLLWIPLEVPWDTPEHTRKNSDCPECLYQSKERRKWLYQKVIPHFIITQANFQSVNELMEMPFMSECYRFHFGYNIQPSLTKDNSVVLLALL